ncbi:uncharacterized protein Z518_04422 [Rhinocladiella mackenziei CBS 650.93]|uniref:SET domain-containing protein n=1 Tax=Rhinocladiella mackenziei CBS 650.93 TaxID=1442369 RepID=A0A0D2ITF9_9EURO|nr:uncharacterized protein Z518_04422 [Rhinocladiella mackenziei CBS 650.93]KIX06446.1 hypothetical protein Z518_04422 [Rhinocladiella mackenziei CBS 650.93]
MRTACLTLVALSCLYPSTLCLGVEDSLYHIELQQLLQSGELDLHFDESSDSTAFGTWSYEPTCTPKLDALDSPLCVYTNKTFSRGRGISIFTTPQIAESFAALPPFRDANVLAEHDINGFRGNWYTREVSGKGIGMFAKHALDRGDLITAYTPVVLAYAENLLASQEREKFLQTAINQLPVPTAELFVNLASVYGNGPDRKIQGIVGANNFALQVGGKRHLAVFPETSRMNHACTPNAQFYLNDSLLTHWVHATRSIEKGEEITIAYYDPLEPYVKRQKYLRDSFHFVCQCPRCLRGEAGDDALTEIDALQKSLGDWGIDSSASVKQAERLIQTFQDQGLDGYLDPAYCHAALTYNAAGSVRGAKKYVQLAIEAIKLRLGPWAPDLPVWKEMLDNPTGHWSWRRRKRG